MPTDLDNIVIRTFQGPEWHLVPAAPVRGNGRPDPPNPPHTMDHPRARVRSHARRLWKLR